MNLPKLPASEAFFSGSYSKLSKQAIAVEVLRSAEKYILDRSQVKPGWTASDHDAYWMIRKRIEQMWTETGIEFFPLVTGTFAESIL